MKIFVVHKLLGFMRYHLLVISVSVYANSVLFKSFPVPVSSRLFPHFLFFGIGFFVFLIVSFCVALESVLELALWTGWPQTHRVLGLKACTSTPSWQFRLLVAEF